MKEATIKKVVTALCAGLALVFGLILVLIFQPETKQQGIMSFGNPAIVESQPDTRCYENGVPSVHQSACNEILDNLIRPKYNYSIIPGGVSTIEEFLIKVEKDPLLTQYFSGCHWDSAGYGTSYARSMYMTYLKDGKIYWTNKAVKTPNMERIMLIRCGDHFRAFLLRCGNEIEYFGPHGSEVPNGDVPPTTLEKPDIPILKQPITPPANPMPPVVPNQRTEPIITTQVYGDGWCCILYGGGGEISNNPKNIGVSEQGTVTSLTISLAFLIFLMLFFQRPRYPS